MPQPPDVAILCGGLGTRLRPVLGDQPKPMAGIGGRPFLELLVAELVRQGCRRIILCTGFGREAIRHHFSARSFGVEIVFSEEITPLGTGGALGLCLPHVRTQCLLLMNGDSYANVALKKIWEDEHPRRAVRLVVAPAGDRADAGTVEITTDGWVKEFREKDHGHRAPYLSAGIYLIPRWLIETIPQGIMVSLERELLPKWIHDPAVLAIRHPGQVLDIGVPDRLRNAATVLAEMLA